MEVMERKGNPENLHWTPLLTLHIKMSLFPIRPVEKWVFYIYIHTFRQYRNNLVAYRNYAAAAYSSIKYGVPFKMLCLHYTFTLPLIL